MRGHIPTGGKKALIAARQRGNPADAGQSHALLCHDRGKSRLGWGGRPAAGSGEIRCNYSRCRISQWSALAERLSRADLKSLPVIEVVFLGQKATPMQSKITAFLTKPIKEAQLGSALLRIFGDRDKTVRTKRAKSISPRDTRIFAFFWRRTIL